MELTEANKDAASSEMRRIDPRAIKKWRLSRLIALLVMLAVTIAAYFFLWHRITDGMTLEAVRKTAIISGLTSGAILLLQLINLIVYPEIEYRQWSYCLTADRIEIKKGIIFHSTTIIPITRIQHVTVSESPFARLYSLAKVDITTAGSTSEIDGLAAETARELCERMKNAVNTKVIDSKLRQGISHQTSKQADEVTMNEGESS